MADAAAKTMSHTNQSWTKTFERIPGGTIAGTAPANQTVEATVPMRNSITGETFEYTQQVQVGADGRFEMTVPYSTTGYEDWGTDEGYTNVSVRAEGPYEFSIPAGTRRLIPLNGTAEVTEGQVVGENESATTVNLTIPTNTDTSRNETTNDTTNETSTDADGSSTEDSSVTETSTNDTSNMIVGPTARPVP